MIEADAKTEYLPNVATVATSETKGRVKPPADALPPLESGDRLHAGEFLRRYDAMPDLKKAELIQGIVYNMASPVNTGFHGKQDALIQGWLCVYAASNDQIAHAANPTVKLGPDDIPQPDSILYRESDEGSSTLEKDGYLHGPPELVVEIAASSASRDAGVKKATYLRAGVKEYLLWRVYDGEIDWLRLNAEEGDWESLPSDPDSGHIKSREFPGLVLDTEAALKLDSATVLKTLQSAINS